MEEFKIVVSQELGTISTNFDDVKSSLQEQMEIYKQLEVNEINKAERKKDISTLRKLIKAVNDKRIEVKKKCLEPYEEFEHKATELVNIINEPVTIIDSQVKEFEEKQRLQKVAEIQAIYNELIGDLVINLALNDIYDSKWENVATSKKSIREEMTEKIESIRQAVAAIRSTGSEKVEEALNQYWVTLDLPKAMLYISRYEQQKKEIQAKLEAEKAAEKEKELEKERDRIRLEERKRVEEENRIREAERRKTQEEQEAKEKAERDAMIIHKQCAASQTYTNIYAVTGTREEFEQVEMYLTSIGLDFERME
jgi:hypothetical protein